MKDCTRLDTEQALNLSRSNILEERTKPKVLAPSKGGDEISKELAGEWTSNLNGAELRCRVDNISATLTISKSSRTHMYGYSLRLDSSSTTKIDATDNLGVCIDGLTSEISSVVRLCAELNNELQSPRQEETPTITDNPDNGED